jgi:hypothetical protein
MARTAKLRSAYGYMRTSSATNIGADKDSERRQRHAIESYARANGYEVAGWFYAGHDHLKRLGVALVPTSAPDHFTEDTPTATAMRLRAGSTIRQ